jgi:hypothetical protein
MSGGPKRGSSEFPGNWLEAEADRPEPNEGIGIAPDETASEGSGIVAADLARPKPGLGIWLLEAGAVIDGTGISAISCCSAIVEPGVPGTGIWACGAAAPRVGPVSNFLRLPFMTPNPFLISNKHQLKTLRSAWPLRLSLQNLSQWLILIARQKALCDLAHSTTN